MTLENQNMHQQWPQGWNWQQGPSGQPPPFGAPWGYQGWGPGAGPAGPAPQQGETPTEGGEQGEAKQAEQCHNPPPFGSFNPWQWSAGPNWMWNAWSNPFWSSFFNHPNYGNQSYGFSGNYNGFSGNFGCSPYNYNPYTSRYGYTPFGRFAQYPDFAQRGPEHPWNYAHPYFNHGQHTGGPHTYGGFRGWQQGSPYASQRGFGYGWPGRSYCGTSPWENEYYGMPGGEFAFAA